MKKKRKSAKPRKPLKATLKSLVEAALAVGVRVSVGLEPNREARPTPPRREPLPGDPTCRTILAHEADDAAIAKEFKAEPSSRWIITPSRIVERSEFFKPKPQPVNPS